MGDVLAGFHTVWEFDTDSVLIRFERGIRTPKLLQALGERRIPYEALAAVEQGPGRRGTVVLRAVPRPGADPLMDAADGQLKEGTDPYRLVLPAERATLAEYYADEIRSRLGPDAAEPAERPLVVAPEPPRSFKAYDGRATFDGRTVAFRWFWSGATSAKWKAGDQRFAVGELADVQWRSPDLMGGHLRLVLRDPERPAPGQADQDPASVVFGMGYGPVHESLPFAAAVLQSVRASSPVPVAPPPSASPAARPDPGAIADRIRHLGDLHSAGLLTDDEFSAKKAELLAEL
ncbi:DUF4429 domain-containing protein [Streptomyces mobaraensis NBRC 13819 = DSM 40847]|uniref:DUF4429 domain-containing protein n=2 Tax=Streptomyces mobaraensis TaxID=35621 RepID=A0A5N5WBK5_STRMB|nr:DUF4429 domain-containing protein [Streptomyces mobaraensis]EME99283.1 hypothetical protein H340_17106 [Streptomyces mobaraensis NBRC 13819 = DSM 40847]KAB7849157.1 DUF4429 domain-containing protein [Streptomyces mobaraensis]QTT73677.1 DUF4429 domain-containing protein [Streptomyces mobaraensis NBRC 13819 = DSM 40847]